MKFETKFPESQAPARACPERKSMRRIFPHKPQDTAQLYVQLFAATIGGNQINTELSGWRFLIEGNLVLIYFKYNLQ